MSRVLLPLLTWNDRAILDWHYPMKNMVKDLTDWPDHQPFFWSPKRGRLRKGVHHVSLLTPKRCTFLLLEGVFFHLVIGRQMTISGVITVLLTSDGAHLVLVNDGSWIRGSIFLPGFFLKSMDSWLDPSKIALLLMVQKSPNNHRNDVKNTV